VEQTLESTYADIVEKCEHVRIMRNNLRKRALKYYLLHPIKWIKTNSGTEAALPWNHLLLDYSKYPGSERLPSSVRVAYQAVRNHNGVELVKFAEASPSEFERIAKAKGLRPDFLAELKMQVELEACILAEYPSEALAQLFIKHYSLDADRAQSLLALFDLKKPIYTRHFSFWRPLSLTLAAAVIIGNTLPKEAFLAVGWTEDQYKIFLKFWAQWLVTGLAILLFFRALDWWSWVRHQRPRNRQYEFCGRILKFVAMEINFNRGNAEVGQPTTAAHKAETSGPPYTTKSD
jgi:hypothetical protein